MSVFLSGWLDRRPPAVGTSSSMAAYPSLSERIMTAGSHPLILSSINDPTARHFYEFSRSRGLPISWATFQDFRRGDLDFKRLELALDASSGIYLRESEESDDLDCYIGSMVRTFIEPCENVVRPSGQSTNWCKPYHAFSLASKVNKISFPSTRLTNGNLLQDGVVIKNCSALPSYVFSSDEVEFDLSKSSHIRQQKVDGLEVRVHVVDDECFSALIVASALDYRRSGEFDIRECEIDADVSDELQRLSRFEGLRFAGIDMIFDGCRAYLIEINPMPGYHTFDVARGNPISMALYSALKK